ncbi:dihydroneopterin aldolase [uncultured Corynebacterium sp.]|uniref:dihydroneopterin aldolase n=1 Tax=uncultured Corynebacterium sp. TaxID=159447 RepID=UPI0025EF0CCB|nr:dihydroneopterin aldolase [uncultured Corynebacterium sp.]
MADRIELTGLECYGYHGVFDHEKRDGQKFLVDITCWLSFNPNDDLAETINYAELADLAAGIVEGEPYDLIETVASRIADAAVETYEQLFAVEVTVHKPQAPIERTFGDVAVVARRSKKTIRRG